MKIWKIIFLISLICAGLSATTPVENRRERKLDDKWLAMDKLKHFSTSLFMTTTLFYGQNRIFDIQPDQSNLKAVGLTISLGVLKELRDARQKRNYFSWRDLTVDILGSGVAIIILNRIG